ncbi:hypothetical protein D3C80_2046510 [compost metagenome]
MEALQQQRTGPGDVVVGRQGAEDGRSLGRAADGDQSTGWVEQAAKAVPVARNAFVAGDDLIEGGDDGVGRSDVFGAWRRRGLG